MSYDGQLPEQWRPAVRTSFSRSPLLRASLGLGLGTALAILPHLSGGSIASPQVLIPCALAVPALVAGVLVLLQSAAIRRIRRLGNNSREQLEELSRCMLYADEIEDALRGVLALREREGRADPMSLIEEMLGSAALRASVSQDSSIRLYLVETTVSHHRVLARGGSEPLPIEVGKTCSVDRTLEEVAAGLGSFWEIVPVSWRSGGSCSLVMLSNRFPTRADCAFVQHLGLALSLTEDRPHRSQVHSRSGVDLRVV